MLGIKRLLGFTLFELVLCLSIVMFFSFMACSSFRYSYFNVKTLLFVRQIVNELYLARSEALSNQQKTFYCYLPTEKGGWEDKRIIQQNKKVIHTFQGLPPNYHLILRNSLGKNNCVVFTPLGFTLSERGSFYLRSPYQEERIIISLSGAIKVESKSLDLGE